MMTCDWCKGAFKRVNFRDMQWWCDSCLSFYYYPKQETAAVARDGIPGGLTVENYGPHPITFYSHSERRRYMALHGLTEREKFAPLPGTDIDPQGIPNPDGYKDPKTLENAAILIARNGQGEDWDPVKAGVLRNLTVEVRSQKEAIDAQNYARQEESVRPRRG